MLYRKTGAGHIALIVHAHRGVILAEEMRPRRDPSARLHRTKADEPLPLLARHLPRVRGQVPVARAQ